MSMIDDVKTHVEKGKAKLVPDLVQKALDGGVKAGDILDAMVSAMEVVGDRFSTGQIFVPEMLMAAKAMSKGVDILKPIMTGESSTSLGACVIGTVQGDLHDIGKNLVAMMIESSGFTIIDLGVDVSAEKFVGAIRDNKDVKLVACSGLLTTTMPMMKNTVSIIKASGLSGFKILVGGAPVTQEFADEIGADGYAEDAGAAATKAKELVKNM